MKYAAGLAVLLALALPGSASALIVIQKGTTAPYTGWLWDAAVTVPMPTGGYIRASEATLPCGLPVYSCFQDGRVEVGRYGPHPEVSFLAEIGRLYNATDLDDRSRDNFTRAIRRPWSIARFADTYATCATIPFLLPSWRIRYYLDSGWVSGRGLLRGCRWLANRLTQG